MFVNETNVKTEEEEEEVEEHDIHSPKYLLLLLILITLIYWYIKNYTSQMQVYKFRRTEWLHFSKHTDKTDAFTVCAEDVGCRNVDYCHCPSASNELLAIRKCGRY